ncbi:MAG: DUF2254 domain-containing protein [Pseudomonadota bacterium]
MIGSFVRGQLRNVRGLSTVPGLIALSLWSVSFFTLWVDTSFPDFANSAPFRFFYTDYETARSVLSTVAAASITTLGLVYSIVLVVFTTAAGNIGPRLLQRFTGDAVNQFTAGLLGGTFLYSLTILHQTDSAYVPSFSIGITFFLVSLSVLQLIYFVHKASTSVTVDEEVAEIARQLEEDIDRLVDDEEGLDEYEQDPPDDKDFKYTVKSAKAGYITGVDIARLVALAEEHNLFINLAHGQGSFLIGGIKFASINRELSDNDFEELAHEIHEAVTVSNSRAPSADLEFSTNLLIEIALRALSPGVNDTFTAVACVDRLSSALERPVRQGLRDHIRADDGKIPRLRIPGVTLEDVIDAAFNPLRRAAAGNVLMTKHIIDALARLNQIGDDAACKLLSHHADLIMEGSRSHGLLKADLDFLEQYKEKKMAMG